MIGFFIGCFIFAGLVCWLVAALCFASVFTGRTDIQLIAAGVYGTFGAVCFVGAAVLEGVD